MKIRPISEWTFYRHRFAIAFWLLAIAVGLYLFLFTNLVPPGMGPSEKQSVLTSAALKPTEIPTAIVDLPYHALQKISVAVLGVTAFGVRLPSLILGAATALFVALILRRWFPGNVAVTAGLVVLTGSWFVSTARLGTPFIMVPFWTSLILLASTHLSQESKRSNLWWLVLIGASALSLYTPFMVYIFIAAWVASFTQPHLRYIMRKVNPLHYIVTTMLLVILIAPLVWGLYKDIGQIWTLLAIPQQLPNPVQFGKDFITGVSNIVYPYNISFGEVMTPLLDVATAVLLLTGGIRLLRDFHAVRSHFLLIWAAILIPVIGFNPNNLVVLMVPAMLVIPIGIQLLIRYWYKLFPRNPYARVFGLLPLALLIVTIVQFADHRYTYGMLYSAQERDTFDTAPYLARRTIDSLKTDNNPLTIVVPEGEEPLYRLVANNRPGTSVINAKQVSLSNGNWIIAESEIDNVATLPAPIAKSVVVNDHKENAMVFRVFQR